MRFRGTTGPHGTAVPGGTRGRGKGQGRPRRRGDRDGAGRIVRLDVDTSIIDGVAGGALSRLDPSIDLLVVGSRDVGPVGRVPLDGVASRLSRHCPTPRLVELMDDGGRQEPAGARRRVVAVRSALAPHDVAAQLGRSPTMTDEVYGHVHAEFEGSTGIDTEQEILGARRDRCSRDVPVRPDVPEARRPDEHESPAGAGLS